MMTWLYWMVLALGPNCKGHCHCIVCIGDGCCGRCGG